MCLGTLLCAPPREMTLSLLCAQTQQSLHRRRHHARQATRSGSENLWEERGSEEALALADQPSTPASLHLTAAAALVPALLSRVFIMTSLHRVATGKQERDHPPLPTPTSSCTRHSPLSLTLLSSPFFSAWLPRMHPCPTACTPDRFCSCL